MPNEKSQMSLVFPDSWERRGRIRDHMAQTAALPDSLFDPNDPAFAQIPVIITRPERYWRRVKKERDGKIRICYAPIGALRSLQERILEKLEKRFGLPSVLSSVVTAFGPGCSIVVNAEKHLANRSSYLIDLHHAFAQIRAKHIFRCFFKAGLPRSDAWLMSRLAAFHGRLTQGAVTSPYLFNCLMDQLDERVLEFTRRNSLLFTRYCDDLCFSAATNYFPVDARQAIRTIIGANGFQINHKKTREGRYGMLVFPGVIIDHGRIEPNLAYRQRLARFKEMEPTERAGHLAYLQQFPRSTRRRILRELRAAGNDV
jgi:RNA-directed DNA polymerase